MASQPANTEITVYRRVRAQVEAKRHDPVNIIGRIRPQILVVPAEEIRVVETRDNLVTDAWRLGHPLVRYARPEKTPGDLYDSASGLDFPVRLTNTHRDRFMQKTAENVADDIQQDARDA